MRREVDVISPFARATESYSYVQVETEREVVAVMREVVNTRSEQCALVAMTLHFAQEKRKRSLYAQHKDYRTRIERSSRYFLESIRARVRRTDLVLLCRNTYYFILPGANQQEGRIVLDRLWDALLWRVHNATDAEVLRPARMSTGYSSYPDGCDDLTQCVALAGEACLSFGEPVQQVEPRDEEGELPRLARKLGIPFLSSLPRRLPERVRHLINAHLAQELRCYPIGRDRDVLTVAMSDPQDSQALDRLHRETGLHIFPVLTPSQELETALERLV